MKKKNSINTLHSLPIMTTTTTTENFVAMTISFYFFVFVRFCLTFFFDIQQTHTITMNENYLCKFDFFCDPIIPIYTHTYLCVHISSEFLSLRVEMTTSSFSKKLRVSMLIAIDYPRLHELS